MIDPIVMNSKLLIMNQWIKEIQNHLTDLPVELGRVKEEPVEEQMTSHSKGQPWFSALELIQRCSAQDMAVIAQKSTVTMLTAMDMLRLFAKYGAHRSLEDILADHGIEYRSANNLFGFLVRDKVAIHHGWRIVAYRHPGFTTKPRWRYKVIRDEAEKLRSKAPTEAQSIP